jgi:hypothetical protein
VNIFFTGWRPDDAGIRPGGGARLDGGSCSVRFLHPDLPGAVIHRTAYAVESGEHSGRFYVQIQTDLIVCGDPARPADTATWTHVIYDDWDLAWPTPEEAEADARDRVIGEVIENAYCLNWEGKPW